MKRSISFVTAVTLLVAASVWSTACGGKEEPPRIDKSRLAPTQPLDETPGGRMAAESKQREALAEDLVVWPEGAGEPRDASADYRECRSRLNQAHDVRDAHPLVQFKWLKTCMTNKGWAMNPDAGVPES